MRHFVLFTIVLFVLSCKSEQTDKANAEDIIEIAVESSGAYSVSFSTISFKFRDKHYRAYRHEGNYKLERLFTESSPRAINKVKDVLSNSRFERYIDGLPIKLSDSLSQVYSASVNSVHYFSVLPYGLTDDAVIAKRLQDTSIKDEPYYVIQITFKEDGGGEDYEDVFVYWFNKKNYTLDYLAYSYDEADGKGIRFREAFNERYVEGIRFVDYKNYKPANADVQLDLLPKLFTKGALQLVSTIALESIEVTRHN